MALKSYHSMHTILSGKCCNQASWYKTTRGVLMRHYRHKPGHVSGQNVNMVWGKPVQVPSGHFSTSIFIMPFDLWKQGHNQRISLNHRFVCTVHVGLFYILWRISGYENLWLTHMWHQSLLHVLLVMKPLGMPCIFITSLLAFRRRLKQGCLLRTCM